MYNKTVKCISIRQPWATLVALGVKDIENREKPFASQFVREYAGD